MSIEFLPPTDPAALTAAIARHRGRGVRIAVLDSGVDTTHPRLARLQLTDHLALEPLGGQVVARPCAPCDPFGHGTAVVDVLHHLAPAAEIGMFQILQRQPGTDAQVVAEAARLAAARGYHIVHCSFGSPANRHDVLVHKAWIDALYLRGIHIVAAASNSGFELPEWPASFPTVLAVGACPDDSPRLRFHSGSLIEFALSGSVPGTAWVKGQRADVVGSSFAAPKVTALLARLLECRPDLDPLLAKSLLKALAKAGTLDPASLP